jgi:hypothetical protein
LWQINERNENKRADLLKDMEAERSARLVELNYQRRIKDEEMRGKEIVFFFFVGLKIFLGRGS